MKEKDCTILKCGRSLLYDTTDADCPEKQRGSKRKTCTVQSNYVTTGENTTGESITQRRQVTPNPLPAIVGCLSFYRATNTPAKAPRRTEASNIQLEASTVAIPADFAAAVLEVATDDDVWLGVEWELSVPLVNTRSVEVKLSDLAVMRLALTEPGSKLAAGVVTARLAVKAPKV